MFLESKDESQTRVTTWTALRHVLLFQIKLAADALRDFVMSPLSLIAFALDAIRKPRIEDSFYLRLMLLGRRTDRGINLFDEYKDAGAFTIDRAADELEELVRKSSSDKSDSAQESSSR